MTAEHWVAITRRANVSLIGFERAFVSEPVAVGKMKNVYFLNAPRFS